jgi:4-amino-4-deoxy-L-arabinose transferase-like glycosyltransferase
MSLALRERFEPSHGRARRSGLAGLVRGRIPPAGLVCALVASLNAIGWSFTTPPFQVTDEPAHFAYVEQLASSRRLPSSPGEAFSPDEQVALRALHTEQISRQPENQPIATAREQRTLERALASAAGSSRRATGAAGVAASQPPLYYALETIPYELGSAGGVLAQLQLMRLLSALMAGATALFTFLFLREALPAVPWAWTVGGLSVALAPLLASTSGGVNPDAMLFAVSAAAFYCLARAFRRGLTPRLAATCGAVTAIGLLTKLTFLGLLPGILLAVAVLAAREARASPRRGAVCLTLALAALAGPVCLYVLVNLSSGRSALGLASAAVASAPHSSSTSGEISYVWQLYLPPLPGMHRDFADITPARALWFNGLVGQYGWADTFFPGWVYDLALVPAVILTGLCLRTCVVGADALRRRATELGVYLTIALGLLIVIGVSSYSTFPAQAAGFAEPRYLLPLIPLMGGAVALAARGAGRRLGPPVGAMIVVGFVAYNLISQLQVVARYYG